MTVRTIDTANHRFLSSARDALLLDSTPQTALSNFRAYVTKYNEMQAIKKEIDKAIEGDNIAFLNKIESLFGSLFTYLIISLLVYMAASVYEGFRQSDQKKDAP